MAPGRSDEERARITSLFERRSFEQIMEERLLEQLNRLDDQAKQIDDYRKEIDAMKAAVAARGFEHSGKWKWFFGAIVSGLGALAKIFYDFKVPPPHP